MSTADAAERARSLVTACVADDLALAHDLARTDEDVVDVALTLALMLARIVGRFAEREGRTPGEVWASISLDVERHKPS